MHNINNNNNNNNNNDIRILYFLFVQLSFDLSEYTADVNGVGTLRLLDAIRTCGLEKRVRLYQVNTSTHTHTCLCGRNNLEHEQFMSCFSTCTLSNFIILILKHLI